MYHTLGLIYLSTPICLSLWYWPHSVQHSRQRLLVLCASTERQDLHEDRINAKFACCMNPESLQGCAVDADLTVGSETEDLIGLTLVYSKC